jgi:hypothetical protein
VTEQVPELRALIEEHDGVVDDAVKFVERLPVGVGGRP